MQWVRWELHPWYEKEQIGGVAIFAEDVTARRLAVEALRETEERYRTLFERTVAGVGIISLDGVVLDCNDAWARHFGQNSAAECQRSVQIRDYCHDLSDCERLLADLRRDGAFVNREWQMRLKDGSPRSVLLNCVLIEQGDREPVIQSAMLDITERKRAEEALRRCEENYRNFVAQSSEGIFRQDLDAPIPVDLPEDELVHRILYDSYMAECNDATVKMYGFNSVQDFLGRRLIEFLDPENPANVQLTREFVRSGFRMVNRESHETDALNAKVFCNSIIGIVEDRKLVRSWGIQRDVTDHVKLESARREAVEALRQSEERFRVALHDSPITVFNQDRDLRYTWMYNPQLYWRHDMLGKTDDEIIGPRKAASLNALKQKVLSSGVSCRDEVAIVQEGATYVFDITVEPLFDVEKNVVGITAASIDIARLREIADRLQESRDRLANQKSYLESQIQKETGFEAIIGQSAALRDVLKKARVVAPTDSSVLLVGETGTGKELVARSIHGLSSRNPNTFVKLNCADVPSGLLESELFGHEKGAFTGAVSQKVGRIELADKGTLFLDEIGEMPPELQPKLLARFAGPRV